MPDECETWLLDDSDLVAEEIRFGLGWNSTSTTKVTNTYFTKLYLCMLTHTFMYSDSNAKTLIVSTFFFAIQFNFQNLLRIILKKFVGTTIFYFKNFFDFPQIYVLKDLHQHLQLLAMMKQQHQLSLVHHQALHQ